MVWSSAQRDDCRCQQFWAYYLVALHDTFVPESDDLDGRVAAVEAPDTEES
jgi:hypothetical protein